MVILGALVNGIATVAGGTIGLAFKSRVSTRLGDFLMQGMGLVVLLVAISGMAKGGDIIVVVLSMIAGGILGYLVGIDGWIRRLGDWAQDRLTRAASGTSSLGSFSEGFVTSSLFICVGAMAIVGSLQSGLQLDHTTLFAKALIDAVVVMVMATTLGIGVPFSGLSVFVYEALLSLGASFIAPFLSDAVIAQMVCVGSLLLLAVGLNMLKITEINAANFLPAAFVPIALVPAVSFAAALFG